MPKIEILAPVGSEEMLRAAVFSGADAVYLGFSGFNARTGAGNFDADSLKEAVRFCHARGVKVHVALNTTVYGGELAALAAAVKAVAESGADAVICQDLAVAQLIGRIAPDLPRHGSTQMSVHTLQGALELKELGFTRVVLARELSLPEVEHITKHCGIETECFVHGALCMCVSGQCYMSAFLGGRSGNRGSCAGPCRLPFEANPLPEGKPGRLHHLSLKDNSAIDKLDKLQALGVASAKIEGRLRTPEYVAAAVSACLAGREGRVIGRFVADHAVARELDTGAAAVALPVVHPLAAAPAVRAEQGDTFAFQAGLAAVEHRLELHVLQNFRAHGRAAKRHGVISADGGTIHIGGGQKHRVRAGTFHALEHGVGHGLGVAGAAPIDDCCFFHDGNILSFCAVFRCCTFTASCAMLEPACRRWQ